MWYINSQPTNGNYGNPQSNPFPRAVELPDDLLDGYIEARGFVLLTTEGSTVTALGVNQEALDAYLEEFPDPPEPGPEPEPGGNDAVWDEMAAAIREGVNDVE